MSRPAPGRWIRAHPFQADSLLAALILSVTVIIWAAYHNAPPADLGSGHFRSIDALGAVLILLQTVPLAWRRSRPVPALVVIAAAGLAFYVFNYLPVTGGVGVIVGLYSVAAHCDRRRSIASLVGVVLVGFAINALSGINHHVAFSDVIAQTLFFAVAWTLGDNLRTRRAYTASLEERAARLEREQDDGARRAVNAERARIARELHDVVAHSVSVMVVQAGAARRVLQRDPDRAAEALSSIETTGRQALDELRRLLGMLREYTNQPPSLTPQPQLRDLDALVAQVEEAGLAVQLTVEGQPRELPSGIDLSVFRIVQEALTNTLKHAGPAHAHIALRYSPLELVLQVTDDGRGAANALVGREANGNGGRRDGQGLVGMRERVALYGGELRTGPRPGGGYEVEARLPLTPADPRMNAEP
jgi:signal transduction histidine kinase